MKKVFLVFAIVLASGVFKSCTELEDNLENEPLKSEVLATEGEEEQDPDDGDDLTNSGGGN